MQREDEVLWEIIKALWKKIEPVAVVILAIVFSGIPLLVYFLGHRPAGFWILATGGTILFSLGGWAIVKAYFDQR